MTAKKPGSSLPASEWRGVEISASQSTWKLGRPPPKATGYFLTSSLERELRGAHRLWLMRPWRCAPTTGSPLGTPQSCVLYFRRRGGTPGAHSRQALSERAARSPTSGHPWSQLLDTWLHAAAAASSVSSEAGRRRPKKLCGAGTGGSRTGTGAGSRSLAQSSSMEGPDEGDALDDVLGE
eukprot:CAMPEP_0170615394 /NCGR_PEP_ID=MMETSP0224-20130122/25312_1 /TAXON_ID=285029 /ORGANISM="Togula jolla, Strain CCCM 725" /LENGTH=179 /DNA_ID=CAMNT_0010941119 /DNA_START=77 /DNA_END=616 /DNA_ORIENTATION=-